MARNSHPQPKASQTASISIYGSSNWNFDGLAELPGPFSTGWPDGWVPETVRLQMLQHPKVYQAINNLKSAIIGDGGRVVPNVPPNHKRFEMARKNAELCAYALRHMNGSWHGTARQFLDATHECHKLGPKEWREQSSGDYRGCWLLERVPVWPNVVYRFMRDRAGRVLEIKVRTTGTENGKDATGWKHFDRTDFALLTFRPVNDSPWGTTVCSPSYQPWYKDVVLDPEEMAMVAQFGRPTVVVIAPGVVDGIPPADVPLWSADGTAFIDPNTGQQKRISPAEAIALKLENYEAGSGLVFPGGTQFKLAEAQNGGELFRFLRDGNARYIASAIMGTHQLTESERQISTNNQSAAEGTVGLGITDGKRALEEMVENDLFVDLVKYNFGESALDFLPIYDLGSAQNGRLIGLMNAVMGYVSNGAFDKTQWWNYCCEVGLPLPDPTSEPVTTMPRATGGADKTGAHSNGNSGDNASDVSSG